MVAGWSTDKTRSLIELWGDANVQNVLDGVQRNQTIYDKIAYDLLTAKAGSSVSSTLHTFSGKQGEEPTARQESANSLLES